MILQRPFLKWAGGKYNLLPQILVHLPEGKRLFEPFIGAGSVFLNTDYKEYHLGDNNADLINLYKTVQSSCQDYIHEAIKYFKPGFNTATRYYQLREHFNQSKDDFERSCLFLYFNRHGYNGLCRYNSSGLFNVPFGAYIKPMFPEDALYAFHEKSQKAKFYCTDFSKLMRKANKKNDVIYADPPYYPLSQSAKFTRYSLANFTHEDQQHLAELAHQLSQKQVTVIISNHVTPETLALYHQAKISTFPVRRTISCDINQRNPVEELLAVYA